VSAPSKPIKAQAAMNIYDDTDDDDLSDISERSHEEDISDPVINKNAQNNIAGSADDRKDKTYSDSSGIAKSGLFVPETMPDDRDKDQNQKRALNSTNSDADEQAILAAATAAAAGKTVVQAHRLEQSDSDDTASATDSHFAKQSAADSFYSPDEFGDDADEQKPNSWRQQGQKEQVKPLSKPLDQQEEQNDTDEDQDDEEHSSDETSSTESQKTPVPIGKMAFGEPYIYSAARFYTV
jgi:hypothetical protein